LTGGDEAPADVEDTTVQAVDEEKKEDLKDPSTDDEARIDEKEVSYNEVIQK